LKQKTINNEIALALSASAIEAVFPQFRESLKSPLFMTEHDDPTPSSEGAPNENDPSGKFGAWSFVCGGVDQSVIAESIRLLDKDNSAREAYAKVPTL